MCTQVSTFVPPCVSLMMMYVHEQADYEVWQSKVTQWEAQTHHGKTAVCSCERNKPN